MARRLPPLNALKAFEAAARHRSFTRAAAELHVTQAAISHQVKQLEQWLGLKLFERKGHALTLSVHGKAYLPDLTGVLDDLAAATARLADNALAGRLRITVLPSFASKWLIPRLRGFQQAHPDIDLQLSSSPDLFDFSGTDYDLGIRSGTGRWRGLQADLVAHETLSPVCSPAVLASGSPLRAPSDLGKHTLLHDQPRDLWPRWLAAAGAAEVDATSGPAFSDSALVLQAAIEGHGVALGRLLLAADDLAAQRLVQPFGQTLQNDYSYWLVYPKAAAARPRVAAFRTWLLQEAGRLRAC
jgi:LysR family glycine cleavage system transcriptional activator